VIQDLGFRACDSRFRVWAYGKNNSAKEEEEE
jgi:hypothetical protein